MLAKDSQGMEYFENRRFVLNMLICRWRIDKLNTAFIIPT